MELKNTCMCESQMISIILNFDIINTKPIFIVNIPYLKNISDYYVQSWNYLFIIQKLPYTRIYVIHLSRA